MADYQKTLDVADVTYKISLRINTFNHLCSFRELSNVKLTKLVKDTQFHTKTKSNDPFTDIEYRIFTKLLKEAAKEAVASDTKGMLITLGTGNRSRWDYVINQQKEELPFIKSLPLRGSCVLYSDPSTATYRTPGTHEDEGYEELTQFNVNYQELRNMSFSDVNTYVAEQEANYVVPEATIPTLTRESIIAHIRGLS